MTQRHRIGLQLRFGDTDALGHVNNAAFAAYAELGRLEFLEGLGRPVTSLILANLTIDFRRQVLFRESAYIETWVRRLGGSSIELAQVVYAEGEVAAEIRSVVVHFDYAAGRATPLTEEMRTALAVYLDERTPTPVARSDSKR